MNKDIQALIEREADRKYLNLDDGDYLDFSDQEKLKAFQDGASFAISLFKWRKVTEELPDTDDIVLVKTNKGCFATAYLHGKKSGFIVYGDEAYKDFGEVIEWMPIPQID